MSKGKWKNPKKKAEQPVKTEPVKADESPKPQEQALDLPSDAQKAPEAAAPTTSEPEVYRCQRCLTAVQKQATSCGACGMALNWAGIA